MTKRLPLLFVLLALAATPLQAGFDEVVRAIESRYKVHHTAMPFFGLVRFAVRVTHINGVSDLQFATWEDAHFTDARAVADIVRRNAGEGFQPIVQSWQRDGECSLIFARPLGGDRVAMLIFAHEHSETTLVRVVVSIDQFSKAMNERESVVASLK